jgi:hypothetical protein
MDPFGVEFGKTIGQLVGEYRTTFAWAALIWHAATLTLLYLILRLDEDQGSKGRDEGGGLGIRRYRLNHL